MNGRGIAHRIATLQATDHEVACLRSPRPEVYPHPTSRALVILNAIAPAFTDRLVKKYGRRRDVTIAPR